jgi:hypothetical protein
MFVEIVDAVRDWIELRAIDAAVVDGLGCRNDQTNFGDHMNRVAFEPSSDVGVAPPMFIGEDVDGKRQLVNTLFAYEVSFFGFDKTKPERDLAHRHVCFDLWEATAQAVQRSYFGVHEWTGAKWSLDRKHGRHGAELVATLVLNVPLFDTASQSATPNPRPGEPKPADPEP